MFSQHGDCGHYYQDVSPTIIEYLGYFTPGEILYKVDQAPPSKIVLISDHFWFKWPIPHWFGELVLSWFKILNAKVFLFNILRKKLSNSNEIFVKFEKNLIKYLEK